MKRLFTLLLLCIAMLAMSSQEVNASHFAGVDLTYQYTGVPNQYLLRLKLYRDCSGIDAPLSVDVCYSSASTGQSGTINMPTVSSQVVPSNACVTAPAVCPGGIGDIEEYIYEATVTLPVPASDWLFSWGQCCRNAAISTLQNAAGEGIYTSALLDNITAPTNSSPSFVNLAYTRFCVNNTFFYDQGAFDIDGDSLVFSLAPAESDNGFGCPFPFAPIPYVNPYSATNPLSSSIPVTINPNTGIVNFIPSAVQVAVICVLVEEYRNGVKIGSVKRDIQINIVGICNQIIPSFTNNVLLNNGGQLLAGCNDYSIIVPFDTTFQCASAVPSDFRLITPIGIPNPCVQATAIGCSNGQTDSLLLTFLNPLMHGSSYLYIKKGFDGNTLLSECGTQIPEFADTVNIVVNDGSIWQTATDSVGCIFNDFSTVLADSIYCFSIANDGTDLLLVDGSGTNYPIANAYGYCIPNGLKCNELLVEMASSVSGPGPYYLLLQNSGGTDGNTIANNCGRFLTGTDTLAILYVDNTIPVSLGSDLTLCDFDTIPTLDAGYSGLSYQWYNINGAIPGDTTQFYTPTLAGTYSVVVSNGPGCSGTDSVSISVIPSPTDQLGNDISQCEIDPLPTFNAGNSGATYQWYLNGTIIPGATSQTYTPTSAPAGTYNYTVEVNNGNLNCVGVFDITLTTIQQFTVDILSNQTLCDGAPLPLLDAGNPGATYQWLLNGSPITSGGNGQTYQTTGAGTYTVIVGSGACAGRDSMAVTVVPIPQVSLSDVSICDTDPIPALDAGISGATYQWFFNGNPINGANGQNYLPTAPGTYSVDVTVPPGCTGNDNMVLVINLTPGVSVADQDICADQSATLDAGNNGATYLWSNGSTSQTISVQNAGDYTVTVTVNGCAGIDSATVRTYNAPAAPTVNCEPGNTTYKNIYKWNDVVGNGNSSDYEISTDGGITWGAANGAGVTGALAHGVESQNQVTSFQVRSVVSSNPDGCRTSAGSEAFCPVSVPNIFTPNADGKNDEFDIDNINLYPNNNVQIFSRWGAEVYNADGYNNENVVFKGTDLPDGVYFYIINLNADNLKPLSGTVTINR